MIVNLSGEIFPDMLTELTNAYNTLAERENLTIYLSTKGGYLYVTEAIIDLINTYKDKTEIVFYGDVFSAGMDIFFFTQCKKRLLKSAVGMCHLASQNLEVREGGKPSESYDAFAYKQLNNIKDTIARLKTTKLTEKEISAIRRKKDVYFTNKRMLELL